MNQKPVIIVGAGLAGSLMAIYLAQKGMKVIVLESRADMRKETMSAGRSINLALSDRGIMALKDVGIDTVVLSESVRMHGRMLHAKDNALKFAPYGKDDSQYINSISRGGLNMILMTEAEKFEHVQLLFGAKCKEIDFENNRLSYENEEKELNSLDFSIVIGADGANSAVRAAIQKNQDSATEAVHWLDHGYKELSIPAGKNGSFRIERNALHIWPRGDYMLIALPNNDGSFTCTLFFPMQGPKSFEGLDSPEKIDAFFKEDFPDAYELIPDLISEFQTNPVGKLGTLKCYPWIVENKVCLIGDAAHAIVPFYGQGMNASFEDCRILNECIEQFGIGNWSDIFKSYQDRRKLNGDAIGALAIENFYEMRDHVADPTFRMKRNIEFQLENKFSDYHSKYSLVTFQPEISYQYAKELGNLQDQFLLEACKGIHDESALDLDHLYRQLKSIKVKLDTNALN